MPVISVTILWYLDTFSVSGLDLCEERGRAAAAVVVPLFLRETSLSFPLAAAVCTGGGGTGPRQPGLCWVSDAVRVLQATTGVTKTTGMEVD